MPSGPARRPRRQVVLTAAQDSEDCWVNCYYDTVFGSIMCLKGQAVTEEDRKAATTGKATDENGKPLANKAARLKIGGRSYQVNTDSDGNFSFPIASLPVGKGTVTVGDYLQNIESGGQPLTGLNVSPGAPGVENAAPAHNQIAVAAGYAIAPIPDAKGRLGKVAVTIPKGYIAREHAGGCLQVRQRSINLGRLWRFLRRLAAGRL